MEIEYREKEGTYLNTLIPQDGDIFVDVGGNSGSTPSNILSYNKKVRIIIIEPFSQNIEYLKNKFGDKVEIVEKAAFNTKSKAILYVPDCHRASLRPYSQGEERFFIETDTLDSILEELHVNAVDLIKIDTEGSEPQILQEFTKYRKGTKFHIECHNNLHYVLIELLKKKANIKKINIFTDFPDECLSQVLGEFE